MTSRYGFGMYQQQKPHMHMSPQLQQAIKILQLPTSDLLEFLQSELEDNPFLEAMDGHGGAGLGVDWSRGPRSAAPLDYLAADQGLTLEKHLNEQLRFDSEISGALRKVVDFVIGNLDANGYLDCPPEQIAGELRIALSEVEQALSYVQGLEPAGVGARNLAECLLLQVRRTEGFSPLVVTLITSHLEAVADYHIPKLMRLLHVSQEEIVSAIRFIKSLNPRPGAAYQSRHADYIIPDVLIRMVGDQFVVSVQESAAPRLRVNSNYEGIAKELGRSDESGRYLLAKRSAAAFLLKCLEQRRLTLLRVTRAIVEEQEAFFRGGADHLKPMVLKHIAEKVDLHESTVSRAVAGKYAQTPWGTYELGYFFPSGFNSGQEDAATAERVKAKLREMVEQEAGGAPYSDQQLALLLEGEGIPISRRTVAKYREELGIASSFKRKRTKEQGR
ncbi:RNA polymerase factor sigma-54 [Paenibacillus lignilyticus]|uniref:RNA polymerase factor sigma-54 n=1 Tax=Paenibacillus lignilyticus TaxID=1172615 RepID=A0ABS5CD37_9BACL|nr:RNA polymerase factor sigma-54 [Paenibacillus lignilyticus]MBP3963907.1 RNA polymerase factor sigma-54 [Paenibacillus lignilyticus]